MLKFAIRNHVQSRCKFLYPNAVVVAHLVELLLPNQEVRGSNPVIGKIYIESLLQTVLK